MWAMIKGENPEEFTAERIAAITESKALAREAETIRMAVREIYAFAETGCARYASIGSTRPNVAKYFRDRGFVVRVDETPGIGPQGIVVSW